MAALKSITVHFAWALTVAGAWWLGGRNVSDSTGGESRSGGRSTAVSAPAPVSPLHGGGSAVPNSDDWLGHWQGPAGIILPEQMKVAVQAALADTDPVRGLRHFTHLLSLLTAENAPAIAQVLHSHPSNDAGSWMALLGSAWGALDGVRAMAGLKADMPAREAALTAWASASPEQARAWLKGQATADPQAGQRDDKGAFSPAEMKSLHASLVRGLAKSDPAAAIAYVAGLSDDRGELTRVLAAEQFRNGAPAAAQWAAQLPDETMRGAALETVARRYMAVDATGGAAWGAEIAGERDTRAAVGRVADRMAEKNVRDAFDWTLKLPPGPGQEEAFQQVFSEWARQDPGASSQELQRMAPGPERDHAIHSFSRILVNESPGDAVIWATAISDPVLRLDTQLDVVRHWNAASPDAARTWAAANLPAADQSRALAPPDD